MKVAVNRCFGGFSLSREAVEFMAARGNERAQRVIESDDKDGRWYGFGHVDGMDGDWNRADPDLIAAVEALGGKASGDLAKVEVIEIPDGVSYEIDDYDGVETIHETHRSW